MAEVTELELTFTRKKQVQQYEPATVSESVTVQVDEDDDLDEIRDEYYDELRESVEQSLFDLTIASSTDGD